MSTTDKPDFARLPIKWIQSGGVAVFDSRLGNGERCLLEQNTSLGALRLFISLCMLADYYTGQLKTTYPKLIALSGLSRPIVARSLKRLVEVGLLEKYNKPICEGTVLQMAG